MDNTLHISRTEPPPPFGSRSHLSRPGPTSESRTGTVRAGGSREGLRGATTRVCDLYSRFGMYQRPPGPYGDWKLRSRVPDTNPCRRPPYTTAPRLQSPRWADRTTRQNPFPCTTPRRPDPDNGWAHKGPDLSLDNADLGPFWDSRFPKAEGQPHPGDGCTSARLTPGPLWTLSGEEGSVRRLRHPWGPYGLQTLEGQV